MKLNEFIKAARKERGTPLLELSELTGISYTALYNLEEGESKKPPHPEVLKKVAPHLHIKYETLMDMAGYLPSVRQTTEQSVRKVPIISLNAIKTMLPISGPIPYEISDKWIYCEYQNDQLFATSFAENNYAPVIQKGDTLVIMPNISPDPGQLVLLMDGKAGPILRRYLKLNNEEVTVDVNQAYNTEVTPYNSNFLIGTVIRQIRDF